MRKQRIAVQQIQNTSQPLLKFPEGIEMFEGRRSVWTSYSGAGLFQWPLHLGRGVVVGRYWKKYCEKNLRSM